MPTYCVVVGCYNNDGRKNNGKGFFRIPKIITNNDPDKRDENLSRARRQQWLKNINRENLTEMKLQFTRVCSDHFISGRPSALYERDSPDWAPTQRMGLDKIKTPSKSKRLRDQRACKRSAKRGKAPADIMTHHVECQTNLSFSKIFHLETGIPNTTSELKNKQLESILGNKQTSSILSKDRCVCSQDFDRIGKTTKLQADVETSVLDLPNHVHKKRKILSAESSLDSHTIVDTPVTSSCVIPEFHTTSALVDGLVQELTKLKDMNESLNQQLKNSKAREKDLIDLVLNIKQELGQTNYLTKELEDRLSSYQETNGQLPCENMITFDLELGKIKSEAVGHDEEEQQNDNLPFHEFVEVKCEPEDFEEEKPCLYLSKTSDENNQSEVVETEDPLITENLVNGVNDI